MTPGKVAVNTIEDDWEGFYVASSDPFPSRPDLKGQDTIRSIHCGDKKQRGRGHADAARSSSGPARRAAGRRRSACSCASTTQGVLRQWKFTG